MSDFNKLTPKPSKNRPSWQVEVQKEFNGIALSSQQEQKLTQSLLCAARVPSQESSAAFAPQELNLNTKFAWFHSLLGHSSTSQGSRTFSAVKYFLACAAALFVFVNSPAGFRDWFSEKFDFVQTESLEVAAIEEIAAQPSPKVFPADFDLEGDASSFQEIMASITGENESFSAEIPADIRQKWSPKEGRLFTWAGAAGVSIELSAHPHGPDSKGAKAEVFQAGVPAVLYIVKLSESSTKKFPKNKLNKQLLGKSGKEKKINVWREGKYGYAFVETVALSGE
jgi:hypothetical protein